MQAAARATRIEPIRQDQGLAHTAAARQLQRYPNWSSTTPGTTRGSDRPVSEESAMANWWRPSAAEFADPSC